MFCDFCKMKGHTRETCYKIIGYPQDSKFKKKGRNSSAYNMVAETDKTSGELQLNQDTSSNNYGYIGKGQMMYDSGLNSGIKSPQSQKDSLESCSLTREQYGQILQFFNKKSEVPHCANVAGTLQWEGEDNW
ncbi:uncharacterized protein LOC129893048 [Solanum dulcamara]|uniref:uncharacterized protein LOC129893048 n=1 Tax=Solanum dulcamara TaxID=45834 RepID=UPI002486C460|nr:uncharacterized protein LOC129893048 [Solanum dulcamara]